MEYGSKSGKFDGGCVSYPCEYPLEASNPYWKMQTHPRMEYVPENYGFVMPWWGIYPPWFSCPYWEGRAYTWTDSTGGMRRV